MPCLERAGVSPSQADRHRGEAFRRLADAAVGAGPDVAGGVQAFVAAIVLAR